MSAGAGTAGRGGPPEPPASPGAFEAVRLLVEYERWCNVRMAEALESLTPDELHRDLGFGLRTPHRTLFHVADVMRGWSGSVGPTIVPPRWQEHDPAVPVAHLRLTLDELGKALLAAATASHEAGLLVRDRRLEQLFHVVTHGTHHRGQLASMLTLLGRPQPLEGGDFGGWSRGAMP